MYKNDFLSELLKKNKLIITSLNLSQYRLHCRIKKDCIDV